jgi:hypothetical protein
VPPRTADEQSRRPLLAAWLLVSLLTLGQIRLFERLLFSERSDYEFVLLNLRGVLEGTPLWKSSKHRLLGPALVRALEFVQDNPLAALTSFTHVSLLAANLLLFWLTLRKGGSLRCALLAVAAFVLVRLLLLYKLEYPWDGLDILLFLGFGHWAAKRGSLVWLTPLLLVGTLNHETVLYLPLWCLLAPLERSHGAAWSRRELVTGALALLLVLASILALREHFYLGPTGVAQETPALGNPVHLLHNLRQFLWRDWIAGRLFISATLLCALVLLGKLLREPKQRRAAAWSLLVIATIFCFGYVNETRLYSSLVAFWFAYGWPGTGPARPGQA